MRYPVRGRRSILDCPVHGCTVALDDSGRIASCCPSCIAEARRARKRWTQRRYRERARLNGHAVSA